MLLNCNENLETTQGTKMKYLFFCFLNNIPQHLVLETSFTDDSHRGALRCVAISSTGVLASSSTDDSIRIHSLKKRKEIGGLFEHNGRFLLCFKTAWIRLVEREEFMLLFFSKTNQNKIDVKCSFQSSSQYGKYRNYFEM